MIRRNFYAALSLLLVFDGLFLYSAGKTESNRNKISIGFLVKRPEELWFQNEWKYAQKCADKYNINLIKIGVPDGDKVLSAIDNLAAQGARGFVICTPDVRLGPAISSKAEFYKMRVVTVDDQFVDHDGSFMNVPYMGISSKNIGTAIGRALFDEFKKRGWKIEDTAALAITFDELNTVKERTDSATEILINLGFPADKIYRVPEKTSDLPGAFDAANIALTQHPEVRKWLVFSINDEGVLGAIRAMENRGFDASSSIGIGIGASSGLKEFNKEQVTGFYATCVIDPYQHGYKTTEMLYKWIKDGVEPPKDIRTPGRIVTRENYKKVLRDLGLEELIER
ncbi:MAG: arabinose ABC transporter substrate-binding protein [Spirochaetota bacterium]